MGRRVRTRDRRGRDTLTPPRQACAALLLELRAVAVDAIVSGDAHLLDLRGTLPVMGPAEFLAILSDRGS